MNHSFTLNRLAMYILYGWSAETIKHDAEEAMEKVYTHLFPDGFKPYEYTMDELKEMGFSMWDEDGPLLAPIWLYNAIPDGTEGMDINMTHETFIKGEIDKDVRFGVIPWGLDITKLKKVSE